MHVFLWLNIKVVKFIFELLVRSQGLEFCTAHASICFLNKIKKEVSGVFRFQKTAFINNNNNNNNIINNDSKITAPLFIASFFFEIRENRVLNL